MSSAQTTPIQSVARAIDVLMVLVDGPRHLGAIAEQVGLPKGTVHRLLMTLRHKGLVIQDGHSGSYMLGSGCFALVDGVMRGRVSVVARARPIMQELAAKTGETASLQARLGLDRVCIAEVPSPQQLKYEIGVGFSAPLHAGASGKCLLAFLDNEARSAILDALGLVKFTKATITDRGGLERDLVRSRERGFTISRGERSLGGVAVAAPVYSGDHFVALMVAGPEFRIRDRVLKSVQSLVVEAAAALSQPEAEVT